MATLGSVELGISLNRSQLDAELLRLESLQVAPINLAVNLSKTGLSRQLKELQNIDFPAIDIELSPDIKGFSRKLKELPKSLPDCIEVCISPDIKGFKKKLEQLYQLDIDCIPVELCPDLVSFERKVTKNLQSKKYSTDIGLNTDTFRDSIEGAFNDAFKRFQGGGILSSIGSILLAPLKLASLAIGTVFTGAGLFLGETLSKGATKGLTESIEASLESSVGSSKLVGLRIGEEIADGIKSVLKTGLDAQTVDVISKSFKEVVGVEDVAIEAGSKRRKRATEKSKKRSDAIALISEEFEAVRPLKAKADKLRADVLEKSKIVVPQSQDFNARKSAASAELQKLAEQQINVSFTKASLAKFQQENFIKQQETFKKQIVELTKKGDIAGASLAQSLLAQIKPPPLEAINDASIKFYENYYTALARSQFVTKGLNERLGNEGVEIAAKTNELNKLIAQLEQLEAQIAKPVTGLTALKAKPIVKGGRVSTSIPPVYQKIFDEVVQRSDSRVKSSSIPELISSDLPSGTVGRYDPKKNAVLVDKETEAAIKAGRLEVKQVEVLIHEFRHALQFGLGKKDLESGVAPSVKLITPDSAELKSLGRRIEGSVDKQPISKQSISRKLEADAYTFAERNTSSIFDSISRTQAKENFESIQGIGGAKADVALKKAQIEAIKRIQKINKLAEEYGIDIRKNFIASGALIEVEANRIESLLEKARSLELLPVDEINALQEQISSTLKDSIESIAAEPESLKAVLNERIERRNKPGGQIVGAAQDAIADFDFKGAAKSAGAGLAVGVNIVKDAAGVLGLSLNNLVNTLAPTVQDAYAIAQGLENVALTLLPGGKTAKSLAKNVGLPVLAAGAATQLPGGQALASSAVSISHQLIDPIATALAQGAAANVNAAINAAFGSIPLVGDKLALAGADLVNSLTSGVTQGAANLLAPGAAAIAGGNVLLKGAGAGAKSLTGGARTALPALPPSKVTSLDTKSSAELKARTVEIEESTRSALLYLEGVAKDFAAAQKTLTKFKKTNPQLAASSALAITGNYERIINQVDTELNKLAISEKTETSLGNRLSRVKSQIQQAFNTTNRVSAQLQKNLDKLGNNAENAKEFLNKLATPGKTIDTALHGGAIKVDATVIKDSSDASRAVTDGLKNAASSGAKEVNNVFADLAHGAVDTIKDVWDVQSPSKVFYKIGLFAVEGLQQGLETLNLNKVFGDKVQIETQNFRKDIIDSRIKNLEKTDVPFRRIDSEKDIAPIDLDIVNRKKNATVTKARFLTENAGALAGLVDSKVGANVSPKQAKDIIALQSSFATLGKAAEDFGKKANPATFKALDSAVKDLEKDLSRLGLPLLTINREIDTFKNKLKDLQGRGEIPLDIDIDSLAPEKFNAINEGIGRFSGVSRKAIDVVGGLIKGFFAFQGALLIEDAIGNFARGVISSAIALDKLRTTLDFASGGASAGAKNLAFVRSEVERLKIPLQSAQEGFTQLSAATRGTALAGQVTSDLFTGISEASTVLSLSAQQTSGNFVALSQSISAGTVSIEELRQLIESGGLVGAFSIAARAMGTTEAQLRKLIESGRVASSDFFPRFAKQLKNEFGDAAVSASNNAQSAIFSLQNTIQKLQEGVGQELLPGFTFGLNAISSLLKGVAGLGRELVAGAIGLSIALLVKLGSIFKGIIADLILTKAAAGSLGGAFSQLAQNINNSFSAKLTVGIFAVIEVVRLLYDTVNTELVKGFDNAAKAAERAAEASKKALNPPEPQDKNQAELPSVNFVDAATRGYVKLDPLTKLAANVYLAGAPAIGEGINRGVNFLKTGKADYTSFADLQRNNLDASLGRQASSNSSLIASAQLQLGKFKQSGGINAVDSQLQKLESDRSILEAEANRQFTLNGLEIPPKYKLQIEDLTLRIQQLNNERADLAKPVVQDLARVTAQIEATKSKLETLKDPETVAKLGGEQATEARKAELEGTLLALRQFKAKSEAILVSLKVDPVLTMVDAFRRLNLELAKANEQSTLKFTVAREDIAKDQLGGFSSDIFASRRASLDTALEERDRIASELKAAESDLAGKQGVISSSNFAPVLKRFGLTTQNSAADIQGVIDSPSIINEQGIKIIDEEDKKILEQIKAVKDAELELHNKRTSFYDAEAKQRAENQAFALDSIAEISSQTISAVQRSEDARTVTVKKALLDRKLTEEQAAEELARIQFSTAKVTAASTDEQLKSLRSYFSEGIISAETFNNKERELVTQQSSYKKQLIEQEASLRTATNQRIIADIERANTAVLSSLTLQRTQLGTDIKRSVLGGKITQEQASQLNTQGDIIASADRIAQIKIELEQNKNLEQSKVISAVEATAKRQQLNQELATAIDESITNQIVKEQQYRDALDKTNDRISARIGLSNSQANLSTSKAAFRAFAAPGLKDLELLELSSAKSGLEDRSATLNDQIALIQKQIGEIDKLGLAEADASDRRTAKLTELANLQGELVGVNKELFVNIQEQGISLLTTRLEKEKSLAAFTESSLERSNKLLESRGNLQKALADLSIIGGESQVAELDKALEITQKLKDETDPTKRGILSGALNNLGVPQGASELDIIQRRQQIEDDIANKKLAALETEQRLVQQLLKIDLQRQRIASQTAVFEAETAKEIAREKGNIKLFEIADRQLASATANLAISNEVESNALKTLNAQQEGARIQTQSGERLRNVNQEIAIADAIPGGQLGSQLTPLGEKGITPLSYAPIDRNTRSYLPPDQSGSVGLNKATSYETLLNQSLGLSGARLGQQIQATRVKPMDTTAGFTDFTRQLREANRGIENRLDKLIEVNQAAIASPRTLNVSSPKPVQDAAKIYSDLSRASVANAKI